MTNESDATVKPVQVRNEKEMVDAALKQQMDLIEKQVEALKTQLQQSEAHAEQARKEKLGKRDSNVITGSKSTEKTAEKLKAVQEPVQKVIAEYKKNPALIPQKLENASAKVVQGLLTSIEDPARDLRPEAAPYVHKILRKAVFNELKDVKDLLNIMSSDELRFLHQIDKGLHEKVVGFISKAAEEQGAKKSEVLSFADKSKPAELHQVELRPAAARRSRYGWDVEELDPSRPDARENMPKYAQLNEAEWWAKSPAERTDAIREYNQALHFEEIFTMSDAAEVKTVAAMTDADRMVTYVQEKQEAVRRELTGARGAGGFTEDDVMRAASKQLQDEMTLAFAHIYQRIFSANQKVFYEDLVREGGLQDSIEVRAATFTTEFNKMRREIESREHSKKPEIAKLKLMRFYDKQDPQQTVHNIAGKQHVEVGTRYNAILATRKVGLSEFLEYVDVMEDGDRQLGEFFHNIGAMESGPGSAREGSIYSQLAQYALRNLTAVDLDSMQLLPDYNLFTTAHRLYTKYLEETHAKNSWTLKQDVFAQEVGYARTITDRLVLEDLKAEFGSQIPEWRLRRAITYGVGLSKGVFMTELEGAAWCDPDVSITEGSPSFKSIYYVKDNALLNALNPMHDFYRWQAEEGALAGLFYMQVDGFRPPNATADYWDHRILWENAKNYKLAYHAGRPEGAVSQAAVEHSRAGTEENQDALNAYMKAQKINAAKLSTDQQTFYDFMCNISHVGSIITRGGWRIQHAYNSHLTMYEKNVDGHNEALPTESINHYASFKTIENIGYEVMRDYVNNKLVGDTKFLQPDTDAAIVKAVDDMISKDTTGQLRSRRSQEIANALALRDQKRHDRDALFDYLFKKYIDPRRRTNYHTFMHDLEHDAEHELEHAHHGGPPKKPTKEQIQLEARKLFLYRVLAGAMRDRMPTKFLRIERNRTTPDGRRLWIKLLEHFNRPELDPTTGRPAREVWSENQYREAIRDVMRVEARMRRVMSERMNTYIERNGSLVGIEDNPRDPEYFNYRVDEASIRRELRAFYTENIGNRLHRLSDSGYESDTGLLRDIRNERAQFERDVDLRIERAVALYKEIERRCFDRGNDSSKKYIDNFAKKIRQGWKAFPFALGSEEIDTQFLAYRSAGGSLIGRAYNDIAAADNTVYKEGIKKLAHELWHHRGSSADDVMKSCVKIITDVKNVIDGMHGHYAVEVAEKMSKLVIAFFKTDSAALNIFTAAMRHPQAPANLAEEFMKTGRGVHRWTAIEVDKFLMMLGQSYAIPETPHDIREGSIYEITPKYVTIFGKKIKVGESLKMRKADFHTDHHADIRKEFGVSKEARANLLFTRYSFYVALFILYQIITKALQEAQGGKAH